MPDSSRRTRSYNSSAVMWPFWRKKISRMRSRLLVLIASFYAIGRALAAADAAAQQARAGTDVGAWRLPSGEAYYANQLKYETSTSMSAKEIHAFGLSEVDRIHGAMRDIMKKVGYTGDLKAFFATLRTDPKFFYPDTAEGKAAYIADTKALIARMSGRLDDVFQKRSRARLDVRPVEPFREQSATSAFYQGPGDYDARPGTYFINKIGRAHV